MKIGKCAFCSEEFSGGKKTRRFCSQSCSAKNRIDWLVACNKARRKYQPVPGLTRAQLCYRANRLKALDKDNKVRRELVKYLGGKCVRCGYNKDYLALVLDHLRGDGDKDRIRLGSRISRYYIKHLDEAKDNLQILCANCNQIKTIENDEHNKSRKVH